MKAATESSVLVNAIEQLRGKSPDEIAAMMRRRGIKGRPGTTQKCPLAMFFDGTNAGTFVIGREFIMRTAGKTVERAKTPKNLADFVRRFDIGKYPDLFLPPPRCLRQTAKPPGKVSGKNRPTQVRVNHFAKDVGRFAA